MSDRADIVATAVVSVVYDVFRDALRRHSPPSSGERSQAHTAIAAYLRDEFADIERQARADRRLSD